jgi:tetratricopeptide (TPR) repeat protein
MNDVSHDNTIYNNIGIILQHKQKYKQAITNYKKALNLVKNDHLAAFNIGTAYVELGDDSKAIEFFDKSIRLNKSFPDAYENLAEIYLSKKNFPLMIQNYLKVVELGRGTTEIYSFLGYAYGEINNHEKSIEFYRKSFESENNPDVAWNVAHSYKELCNYEQSLHYYNLSLEMYKKPEFSDVQFTSCDWNSIGTVHHYLHNYDEARKYFKMGYDLNEGDIDILTNLGDVYLDTQNYDEAEKYFSQAITIETNDELRAYAAYRLGDIHVVRSQYHTAIEHYQNSIVLNISDLNEVYQKIGEVYELINNYEKASEFYSKAIKVDEDEPSDISVQQPRPSIRPLLDHKIDAAELQQQNRTRLTSTGSVILQELAAQFDRMRDQLFTDTTQPQEALELCHERITYFNQIANENIRKMESEMGHMKQIHESLRQINETQKLLEELTTSCEVLSQLWSEIKQPTSIANTEEQLEDQIYTQEQLHLSILERIAVIAGTNHIVLNELIKNQQLTEQIRKYRSLFGDYTLTKRMLSQNYDTMRFAMREKIGIEKIHPLKFLGNKSFDSDFHGQTQFGQVNENLYSAKQKDQMREILLVEYKTCINLQSLLTTEKEIHAQYKKDLKQFFEEVYEQAQINHPNVVRLEVYFVDFQRNSIFLQYPLLRHGTLTQWVGSDNTTIAAKVQIQRDMLYGLHHIHLRGISHKKLHPNTIYINDKQRALMGNFHLELRYAGTGDERTNRNNATSSSSNIVKIIEPGTEEAMKDPLFVRVKQPITDYSVADRQDMFRAGMITYRTFFPNAYIEYKYDSNDSLILPTQDAVTSEMDDCLQLSLLMLNRDPNKILSAANAVRHPLLFNSMLSFFNNQKLQNRTHAATAFRKEVTTIAGIIIKKDSYEEEETWTRLTLSREDILSDVLTRVDGLTNNQLFAPWNITIYANNSREKGDNLETVYSDTMDTFFNCISAPNQVMNNSNQVKLFEYGSEQLSMLPNPEEKNMDYFVAFSRILMKMFLSQSTRPMALHPIVYEYLIGNGDRIEQEVHDPQHMNKYMRWLELFDTKLARDLREELFKPPPQQPQQTTSTAPDNESENNNPIHNDVQALRQVCKKLSDILVQSRLEQLRALRRGVLDIPELAEALTSVDWMMMKLEVESAFDVTSDQVISLFNYEPNIESWSEYNGIDVFDRRRTSTDLQETLQHMTSYELSHFLIFCTGRADIPTDQKQIAIRVQDGNRELSFYPFQLNLPDYQNMEVLKSRLISALNTL